METQIITDASGEPIRVIMDYQEYLKMIGELKRPLPKTVNVEERNPLDWESLTESVRSVLTGLVALASREHMKEMKKPDPNQDRIAKLVALRDEAFKVNSDPENFKSMERMEEIIAKFSPILLAEKKKIS